MPEEAIIHEGDVAHVWVGHDDKTITLRQIQTGRSKDGMVEVLSGLQKGEMLVTSGALFIDRAGKGK